MIPDIISVAPMLDCTDRHFRYLMRLITRKARLYTEMLTIKEVLEDKTGDVLTLHPIESPVTLQLGGSNPQLLAKCTELAVAAGYDEVNLNVGCPSQRVQSGSIGACLMLQPALVADCISAMQEVSSIPITVKCRLGVDHWDTYDHVSQFVDTVTAAGCKKIIVHARKAWLSGLSPKQNREVPPLQYEAVYRLKKDFPEIYMVINGGIKTFKDVGQHLEVVEGAMLGRAVYNNPYLLAEADQVFYNGSHQVTEQKVVQQYLEYIESQLTIGVRLNKMTKHLLGLFHGKPRATAWRKHLSCHASGKNAGSNIVQEALALMEQ